MARSEKARGKVVRRLGVNIYGNVKYDKLLKKKPQGPGQER
ncbi:MAG: 30S ribosomal protein S4, partial [Spirochaetales bacterium]|nr:30S ribosomal protein S4 [Spirochaetales bacterium]